MVFAYAEFLVSIVLVHQLDVTLWLKRCDIAAMSLKPHGVPDILSVSQRHV